MGGLGAGVGEWAGGEVGWGREEVSGQGERWVGGKGRWRKEGGRRIYGFRVCISISCELLLRHAKFPPRLHHLKKKKLCHTFP